MELGIPVVVAVNMMDVIRKNGDKLDTKKLANTLGYGPSGRPPSSPR